MSNPGPNILSERTDRRKLPIGIQTFREIRAESYYYVDKTAYIRRMMDEGKEPEWELVELENARLYLEMAMMAHASHVAGARVGLPLARTANPFDEWE